jgi:PTS system cellobiose-specific IIB component
MKILLVCAFGMSTSIIADKIRAAKAPDEDLVVEAKEVSDFRESIKNYDVALLGPQIGFRLEEFSKIAKPYGVPVMVINSMDYGLCKGDAILKAAKEKYKEGISDDKN